MGKPLSEKNIMGTSAGLSIVHPETGKLGRDQGAQKIEPQAYG